MTQLSIFHTKSPLEMMIEEMETGDPDGLRYYQRECADAVLKLQETNRSVLSVLATGLGKTQIFGALAKNSDGPTLILAERDELVEQAKRRIEIMTGEYAEVEKAEMVCSHRARLVVGSVQSFKQKRLDRLGKNRFARISIDEAHHSVAPTYRRIMDWFDAKYDGWTATPDRADEKALGAQWDEVAYVMDIEDGIDAGYLVPFHPSRCSEVILDELDLDALAISKGDFQAKDLDAEMARHVEAVVRKTLELEPDRPGICFFPGVRSAELAMQRFNGVSPGLAAFVSGETDPLERKRIMEDFRKGRIRYLCNCQVATEGFDAPATSLIVQARPTKSRGLYAQMTGRGTRPAEKVVDHIHGRGMAAERRAAIAASGKPDLVVLDFVGNCNKHELACLVDILGGNYTPAEVKTAKKLVKEGREGASEALLRARRELKNMAEAMTEAKAKLEVTVRPFDPFQVLGLKMEDEDRYAHRFGGVPATPGQQGTLAKFGIPQQEIDQLSKRAATKLIDKCIGRMKHGWCSYRMLRQLQRFGITQMNIRQERAEAAMNYLKSKGWGKEPVDPEVLREIINHKRVAGED